MDIWSRMDGICQDLLWSSDMCVAVCPPPDDGLAALFPCRLPEDAKEVTEVQDCITKVSTNYKTVGAWTACRVLEQGTHPRGRSMSIIEGPAQFDESTEFDALEK